MSDEGRTGLVSIADVDGGMVIKFTGPENEAAGATAPHAASSSSSTFVIGDVEGSAILRFLTTGSVKAPDSGVARFPVKAAQGQSYGDT